MRKQYKKPFLLLFWVSLITLPLSMACSQPLLQNSDNQAAVQVNQQHAQREAEMMYQALMGEFSTLSGNFSDAYAFTLEVAQKTKDERLFERAVMIAQHAQNHTKALEAAQKWQAAIPESKTAHHFTLDLLVQQGQFSQTPSAIQGMLQATDAQARPETIASMGSYLRAHAAEIRPYYTQAMTPWLQSQNMQEAAAAWVSIAIIEQNADHPKEAYEALLRGHTVAPDSQEVALLAAEMISADHPELEKQVLDYLNLPHASERVRLLYVQSLLQRSEMNQAKEQLEAMIENPDTFPIAWYLLGSIYIEDGQHVAGMRALKSFLDKTQDDDSTETIENRDRALLQIAQGELESGKPKEAQQWINQISSIEAKKHAQDSYINILIGLKQYDQALQAISQLPEGSQEERISKITLHTQVLTQAQRWENAYHYLSKETQRDVTSPHLLYLYALTANETGHLQQAETILRQLIKDDPHNAVAMNALAYIWLERDLHLSNVKELIRQALALDPDNPAILDSSGWLEFKQGNIKIALELLEKAYNQYPDPEVAAHYGQALWASGQQDHALAVWQIALSEDSNNRYILNTLKQLGVPLSKVKNFDLSEINLGDQNDLTRPDNFLKLIDSLFVSKNWQKLYDTLESFNTQNQVADLIDLQAHAANQLGLYDVAEQLYRRAIATEPEQASSYNNLGYMLIEQKGRLKDAEVLIRKAHELDPDSAVILDSLGWVEFKQGNTEQAIVYLRKAYQRNPDIAEIGIHLAEVLWKKGEKAEALLIWKDVQNQHPQGTPEYEQLQQTLQRLQIKLP